MKKDREEIEKIMKRMWTGLHSLYLTPSESSPVKTCLDELTEYVLTARTESAERMNEACKQIVRDANET